MDRAEPEKAATPVSTRVHRCSKVWRTEMENQRLIYGHGVTHPGHHQAPLDPGAAQVFAISGYCEGARKARPWSPRGPAVDLAS